MPDKDYFEYKRAVGKWTGDQELLWDYLSHVTDLLAKIVDQTAGLAKDELKTNIPLSPHHQSSSPISLGMRPE